MSTSIFAIRTTAGQERNTAELIETRVKMNNLDIVREWYISNEIYSCIQSPSYHLYTILVDNNKKFIKYMKKNGVQCGIHYKCLHKLLFKEYSPNIYNKSLNLEKKIVSIPFHEDLKIKDIKYISRLINEYNK